MAGNGRNCSKYGVLSNIGQLVPNQSAAQYQLCNAGFLSMIPAGTPRGIRPRPMHPRRLRGYPTLQA